MMLFAKTKSGPKTTIVDEPEPVFRVVKKADLDQRFNSQVSSDTQLLKVAMDQSWDDIISQFNGLLTVNYREQLSKQAPVKYVNLALPMPRLVEEAIKAAHQPIEGSVFLGPDNMFHQVIVQSYDRSLLKPAIDVSDFNLSYFYYDKPLGGGVFKFGIALKIKKSEDK